MRIEPILDPESIDEDHIHVVAAIIWQSPRCDRFLIAQRQKGKHLEHYWELPGGKIEPGESPWHALKREIAEEIDLQLVSGMPYLRVYYRYPERNVLLDTWWIESYRGEPRAMERQTLEWIGIEDRERYRFPPADEPILEAIRRNVTA